MFHGSVTLRHFHNVGKKKCHIYFIKLLGWGGEVIKFRHFKRGAAYSTTVNVMLST